MMRARLLVQFCCRIASTRVSATSPPSTARPTTPGPRHARSVRRELLVDGFVQRYRHDAGVEAVDGLLPGEGAFFLCSFWFVDNLILLGELDEAVAMFFERLPSPWNELGLLAEEYDPALGRLVGNYLRRSRTSASSTRRSASTPPCTSTGADLARRSELGECLDDRAVHEMSAKVATSVARP